jgi:hypothetical protein
MGFKTDTFVDGSPPQLDSDNLNGKKTEINNLISTSGQTPSDGVLDQMPKAVSMYAARGDFYTDSGSANAYIASTVGSQVAPITYENGMRVRFVPANNNTGASTVNVDGLGIKDIKLADGTDPQADVIVSGTELRLRYDGTDFVIQDESINTLKDLDTFHGLPINSISTSIPGPTFDLDNMLDGEIIRGRVDQTLGASVSNQVMATFSIPSGNKPFLVFGTIAAFDVDVNVDMASWDFHLIFRLGSGTNLNLDVNNRALRQSNFNMHTQITFNTNLVTSRDLEFRVSNAQAEDIESLIVDFKVLKIGS